MVNDELSQELRNARQKGLLASVLILDNTVRVRFFRTSDYQKKRDKVKNYILNKYKNVKDVRIIDTMMYMYFDK